MLVPVLIGVLAGAACGALNGVVITAGPSRAVYRHAGHDDRRARPRLGRDRDGRPVSNLSREFTVIGAGQVLGVPVPVIVLSAVAAAAWVVLRAFRIGRYLYAVGGNENAARASGMRVNRVKMFAYTICGALAGLAGVVLAARITTGQPNAGVGYELDAIAAVVIGGTSLRGGAGGIGGADAGCAADGSHQQRTRPARMCSSYYQQIVKGIIIVGAVWLDRSQRKS